MARMGWGRGEISNSTIQIPEIPRANAHAWTGLQLFGVFPNFAFPLSGKPATYSYAPFTAKNSHFRGAY